MRRQIQMAAVLMLAVCFATTSCGRKRGLDSVSDIRAGNFQVTRVDVLWLNSLSLPPSSAGIADANAVVSITNETRLAELVNFLSAAAPGRQTRNHPYAFDQLILRLFGREGAVLYTYVDQDYDEARRLRFYTLYSCAEGSSSRNAAKVYEVDGSCGLVEDLFSRVQRGVGVSRQGKPVHGGNDAGGK